MTRTFGFRAFVPGKLLILLYVFVVPFLKSELSPLSANGARYDSQGQVASGASHVAPGKKAISFGALKERNKRLDISHLQCSFSIPADQGRRASLRSALAPGYHILRLRR